MADAAQSNGRTDIRSLSPEGRLAVFFGVCLALLLSAHLTIIYLEYGAGLSRYSPWLANFNMDAEKNVPALYSALVIFAGALMLVQSGLAETRGLYVKASWMLFALVFAFLGIDEFYGVHEVYGLQLSEAMGITEFGWIAGYLVIMAGLCVVLAPWFMSLDRHTQIRFVLAGSIFMAGAVVIETIAGKIYGHADPTVGYDLLVALEEGLEILGMSIFTHTVFARVRRNKVG